MKILLSLVSALILLNAPTAQAETKDAQISMVGIGAITCKQWNEAEKDDFVRGTLVQWVYGYYSGVNKVRAVQGWRQYNIRQLNTNNILETIDHFCTDYPDYILSYAADSMKGRIIYKMPLR